MCNSNNNSGPAFQELQSLVALLSVVRQQTWALRSLLWRGLWFRVEGLGLRVQGFGFRARFRGSGLGFWGEVSSVRGSGVLGSGCVVVHQELEKTRLTRSYTAVLTNGSE